MRVRTQADRAVAARVTGHQVSVITAGSKPVTIRTARGRHLAAGGVDAPIGGPLSLEIRGGAGRSGFEWHLLDMQAYEGLETAALTDLLARARSGEPAAFTELVERHHADMVRIAFAITGDLDAARDASQAAWVKAWQRLPTIREASRLRAWLIAIAANEARQHVRADRRRRVREVAPLVHDEPATQIGVTSADHLDLVAALTRVRPDDRALLAMRYLGGLTADEIGTATGLTASGVRSRLSRLVARLREELDDE